MSDVAETVSTIGLAFTTLVIVVIAGFSTHELPLRKQ